MGYTVNNVGNLLIGKNIAQTATAGAVAEPSTLAVGEVVVTDENGYILDGTNTLSTYQKVFLVQGQGSSMPVLRSDAIYRNGVTNYSAKLYTPCTEQVDYIGYNPSSASGSIEVINSNQYEVQALLRPISFMFGDKLNVVFANYKSSTAATQSEVAQGLAKNLILNTQKYPNIPFKVERVNDSTTTTAFTTAKMVLLTKDSAVVSFYDLSFAASTSGAAITKSTVISAPSTQGRTFTFTALTSVAHKVQIGATAYLVADTTSGATANAAAIAAAINADTTHIAAATSSGAVVTVLYNTVFSTPPVVISDYAGTPAVVAVTVTLTANSATVNAPNDANPVKYLVGTAVASGDATMTLDIPWQGATGYAVVVTGTSAQVLNTSVGVASVITNWGIKLTGYPTQYTIGAKKYEKSRWATTLQTCGATTVDTAYTVANEGIGVYAQISDMEWFMQGFLGQLDRIQIPPVAFIANTETNGNYSVVELNFQEAQGTGILGTAPSFKQIYIACDKTKGSTSTGFIANSQFNKASSPSVLVTLDKWLDGLFSAQVSKI